MQIESGRNALQLDPRARYTVAEGRKQTHQLEKYLLRCSKLKYEINFASLQSVINLEILGKKKVGQGLSISRLQRNGTGKQRGFFCTRVGWFSGNWKTIPVKQHLPEDITRAKMESKNYAERKRFNRISGSVIF